MPIDQEIVHYLETKGWLIVGDTTEVELMGRDTSNANYMITAAGAYGAENHCLRVLRQQAWAMPEQAEYEYAVLRHLVRSRVTPRPYFHDAGPDAPGRGTVFMEYLEGDPLDPASANDLDIAAQIYAAVHQVPVKDEFILQSNPILLMSDGGAESAALAAEWEARFAGGPLVLAHGPVRPDDFLIDRDAGRGWMVDWERAVITDPCMDLAWFIHGCLGDGVREAFEARYLELRGLEDASEAVLAGIELCLRALRVGCLQK